MNEVLYLSDIDKLINITEEEKEDLIESIYTRLLNNYISGDMYKNGILTLGVSSDISSIPTPYYNIDILNWKIYYNKNNYGAFTMFNSKNTKKENLFFIELVLKQIIETMKEVKKEE